MKVQLVTLLVRDFTELRDGAWGSVVVKAVPGSIPGGATGAFSRDSPDRTMCPEID